MNDIMLSKLPLIQGVNGIGDLLDFRARSQGQREAIVCDGERVSYNQLKTRASAIAHHLQTIGVRSADRVAVFVPNGIDFVAAFFGTAGMDAVVVPVNPLLKPDEIAHIILDSQAKSAIVHEDLLAPALEAFTQANTIDKMLLIRGNTGDMLPALPPALKVLELDRQRAPGTSQWPVRLQTDQMPAVIIYTSGTTGKPKGAMLSHHNLLSSFPSRLEMFDVDESDRLLGMLPLCHIFGISVVILGTISKGATIVLLPKFEAPAALQLIGHEKVTLIPAVPAMYQMMLFELKQAEYDLSSVRVCWSGAAPLPVEIIGAVEEKFGAPLLEGYGLTETAAVSTINPMRGVRKVGSVGPTLPGVKTEVLDADWKILPPGPDNVGEIAVSGSNVMIGYYRQPEATAEVLRDGWFLTGDLGYKDDDGYFYIVGRKKELIIRGGSNVYPREVEDVIAKIPGVRDVAVFGIPDEFMGERVKAVVVATDPSITEDAVKAHCEKYLANYKVPRIVEFAKALPRNSTGKVLKRLLK